MKPIFRVIYLALLTFSVPLTNPSSVMAQDVQAWENLSLYGGYIYDIAIDRSNPDKMFAGTHMGDGLFVTTDGGAHWQAVETENVFEGEDTFKDHAVWSIEIAPSNPNAVWVAHNFWVGKSTDGGQTWLHIRNSSMQRDCTGCGGTTDNFRYCMSLAVDPNDDGKAYVGTGGPWNTYESGGIYRTDDGGVSWTKMNQGNNFDFAVVSLAIDPQESRIIWAVTNSYGVGVWGGTLYRSEDEGETWEEIFSLTPMGGAFLTIAVKPNDSNVVFTGSGYGVIRHEFDGAFWQYQWPVISDDCYSAWDITFDPQDPDVLYAAWRNTYFGDLLPRISRSVNGGTDWETYIVDHDFRALAVHPTDRERLFGGDASLGLFRSQDHGQNWAPMNNGINAIIVYDVDIDPNDSSHFLVGTGSGTYEKQEGADWSRLTAYETRSIRFHPTDSLTSYAGLRSGYLAKTTDGGQSWSYTQLPSGGYIEDIEIDPLNTETIYLASYGGVVYLTEDGGVSLSEVLTGENQNGEAYGFNTIAIDPSNPQHVFAGGGNYWAPKIDGDLWESEDRGMTWTRNSLSAQNVIVNDLLIDPADPDIMYAGCGYSGGTENPVYRSTDGGITWDTSFRGIPELRRALYSIWGSSATDVFAVGSDGRIHQYNGDRWTQMPSGTEDILRGVWGVNGTNIFAVGFNGRILRYDGNDWSSMASNTTEHLLNIWGDSRTNIFAVGYNGTILHYDGNDWSPMASNTTENLWGIWGSSGTNIFAVGENGTILHYEGNDWSPMASGTTEELDGIWGTSGTNIFTAGGNGTILHYDGSDWSAMISDTTRWLHDVWGTSETHIVAVGVNGIILNYNGSVWNQTILGTKESFQCIWGTSEENIFMGGDYGGIFHYDGHSWSTLKEPGATWNAVTDLEFHTKNTNIIYAATTQAGVYVSPNRGSNWLNLGKPVLSVHAISTSSLYAATQAGLLQCTGTGVIAGQVIDAETGMPIDHATIFSDLGIKTNCVNGEYMMVNPAGVYELTAIKDNYANETLINVTVYGGDVSWVNFEMEQGASTARIEQTGGSGSGGSGCFIATAAQESWMAKETE
ncbi:MAG: hypothetical protein JW896_12855 [Deltaproteobacteria bacterium]|nr:hypothetical protein [Deltaproteobacteria bacterium]